MSMYLTDIKLRLIKASFIFYIAACKIVWLIRCSLNTAYSEAHRSVAVD